MILQDDLQRSMDSSGGPQMEGRTDVGAQVRGIARRSIFDRRRFCFLPKFPTAPAHITFSVQPTRQIRTMLNKCAEPGQ